MDVRSRGKPGRFESLAGARADRRQVEQRKVDCGCPRADRRQKRAFTTADVEQAAMTMKRIGVDHLCGDQRLRRCHQRRIGGDLGAVAGPCRLGVAPMPRQPAAAATAPQQPHRIGEVGVEQMVMRDHLGDAAVSQQRRARAAQRPRRSESFDQTERCRAHAAGVRHHRSGDRYARRPSRYRAGDAAMRSSSPVSMQAARICE